MLLEFTKGDLTLLPKLREFAKDKEGWNQDWRKRQDQAENYVNKALEYYLQSTNVDFFKEE